MSSRIWGSYKAKTRHGWFTNRLKVLINDLDEAFTKTEGGLERPAIPYWCRGDNTGDHAIINPDSQNERYAYCKALNINYGLGYWPFKTSENGKPYKVYALEGLTAKNYKCEVKKGDQNKWVVSWDYKTKVLSLSFPPAGGTIKDLCTALVTTDVNITEKTKRNLGLMFAVEGTADDTITLEVPSTAITAPSKWGTGLTVKILGKEIPVYTLSNDLMSLYLAKDVFNGLFGTSDADLPVMLNIDVWVDGYLLPFMQKIVKSGGGA